MHILRGWCIYEYPSHCIPFRRLKTHAHWTRSRSFLAFFLFTLLMTWLSIMWFWVNYAETNSMWLCLLVWGVASPWSSVVGENDSHIFRFLEFFHSSCDLRCSFKNSQWAACRWAPVVFSWVVRLTTIIIYHNTLFSTNVFKCKYEVYLLRQVTWCLGLCSFFGSVSTHWMIDDLNAHTRSDGCPLPIDDLSPFSFLQFPT